MLGGCAATEASSPASATPQTPAPSASATRLLAVDMHNHVYPAGTEPHPHRAPHGGPPREGPPHGAPPREGPPRDEEQGPALSIAEELKRSGLTAVCASFVLDFAPNNAPGDARANYLRWLAAIDAELAKGGIRRALSLADLQAAHAEGRPTIIQTVEGAQFIEGQLARVEEVYGRGVRHLQLLHESDDKVSPLGDTNTAPAHLGGLTPFGVEVVKECNRLGILVDLAHASHETVLGALKVATQPLVVSHTSLDTWTGKNERLAAMMKPRLISKEHAKVVADAGGVIGVWTHMAGSLEELVGSIKAMVDAVGVDHVGLGSDTDLLASRVGKGTNVAWSGLTGGFFEAIAGQMRRDGFANDEIAKIAGGNYCRVFGKVTAGHA
ncbi:Membrane dipeptidase precursor [Minicystis rosea]|nr:Membrane dipeptidase precursor [Minicystis rosea]